MTPGRFTTRAVRGLVAALAIAAVQLACSASKPGGGAALKASGASVVVVSIDTLRADRLPAYGYKGVETPAIDGLRRDSILFENAYAHSPLTLPSHASLLSGLLPPEHGVRNNIGYRLDAKHETLAETLRARGYATGAAVSAFVLRRTKSEVAQDLPEKIVQEMVVPMSEEQQKLYKQILRQVRESVMSEVEKQGIQKSSIQILAALTRLRQVACDPRLLGLEGNFEEESGKLNALKEIVSEAAAGGHKVLIFSQFVSMLKLIREALDADKISYAYLDGSTKDRQTIVDKFNDDESQTVFLISLKAGGTGLNLTGADTVIHFDPWWNPAVEDQATDRAHRIGQTKVVTVYRLIARDSVEEKILQLSEKKRELVANVLSTEDVGLKGMTKQDVESLFAD